MLCSSASQRKEQTMTDPRDITDDADFPAPKCGVCGIPWVSHMGIMGVCLWNKALKEDLKESQEEIALLRKERDAALAVVDEFIIDTRTNTKRFLQRESPYSNRKQTLTTKSLRKVE